MSRLTRAQRAAIETAMRHTERAQAFLARSDVAVGRLGTTATTTLHFTRQDGATFYPVAKECGSDLVGLAQAISGLRTLLGRAES
jgi:hypothetical protein